MTQHPFAYSDARLYFGGDFTRNRPRGFTMIELLVSVAIVGILSLLVFGAFHKMTNQAQKGKCAAQLRQIGLLVGLYQGDHGGQFPAGSGYFFKDQTGWSGAWYDPSSAGGPPGLLAYTDGDALKKLAVCPNRLPIAGQVGNPPMSFGYPYVVNYHLMPTSGYSLRRIQVLSKPTSFILMSDSRLNADGTGWTAGFNGYSAGAWLSLMGSPHTENTTNILWADGHVSSTRVDEITRNNIWPDNPY